MREKNPVCNSIQYAGGLSICKHKRILLDEDQPIRTCFSSYLLCYSNMHTHTHTHIGPELLRYHMKYRFWFQEYVPKNDTANASHFNLDRIYYQTEAWAGEYDVVPAFRQESDPRIPGYPDQGVWPELSPGSECTGNCPNGTDCVCHHTLTYNWTVSNIRLLYAGGHCHAPSCVGIWLYRNDPGHEMELLCHQAPIYGKGNVEKDKFDEFGYVTLPPCLWGDDEGLAPSILLPPNTPLVSIKKNINTRVGHFGEMASWQMRGTSF